MIRFFAMLFFLTISSGAVAQNSGGSFGGSRGFGGGSPPSGGAGSGGAGFGGSGGAGLSMGGGSGRSWADQHRQEARQRREAEAAQRREERRLQEQARAAQRAARAAEQAAREAERARLAEIARIEELARVRALPDDERASYSPYFRELLLPPPPEPSAARTPAVLPLRRTDPPSLRLSDPFVERRSGRNLDQNAGLAGGALALPPLMFLGLRVRRKRKKRKLLAKYSRQGRCEVMRLSFVFTPVVRARLQAELRRLAGRFDMSTAAGMHAGARAVVELLAAFANETAGASWSSRRETAARAQERFDSITRDLKARYRHDALKAPSAEAYQAAAHEGQGWVVVSIVVGALTYFRRGSMSATRPHLLQELARVRELSANNLVAFEVIWSPAEELDRMSSAELHLLYPEVLAFENLPPIARCGYCESLYAEELGECSTCGAPRAVGRSVQ